MSDFRPPNDSEILLSRRNEASRIAEALETARRAGMPRVVGVQGPSGIGKTALIDAACNRAEADGWVVAAASAYAIQANVPFAATRNVVKALVRALNAHDTSYAAGLDSVLQPATQSLDAARGLMALVDGATLDFPLLLVLDDAQWADRDSLGAVGDILSSVAERCVVLLTGRQTAVSTPSASVSPDTIIDLQPLDDTAARQLVTSLAPGVQRGVALEIVRHARGQPIDLVSLTQAVVEAGIDDASGVALSRRSLIARNVRSLEPTIREFLQTCSLIGPTVEHRLLHAIWPDSDSLDGPLAQVTGRYVRPTETGIAFVHALMAEGIRDTIAAPIPYRRRIIAALRRLGRLHPEEYALLATQLAACGENHAAFDTLAELAARAFEHRDLLLLVSASAQAVKYEEPPVTDALEFYRRFTEGLTDLGRHHEAAAILERILHEADRSGKHIPGELVYRLILAQANDGRRGAARASYTRYSKRIIDPSERFHLLAADALFCILDGDSTGMARIENDVAASELTVPPSVRFLVLLQKALLCAQIGEFAGATTALEKAKAIADSLELPSSLRFHERLGLATTVVEVNEFGTRAVAPLVEVNPSSHSIDGAWQLRYSILRNFLEGRWDDTERMIATAMERSAFSPGKRWLLALAAAIASLRGAPCDYEPAIEADVRQFMQDAHAGNSAVPLWWAPSIAKSDKQVARAIVGRLIKEVDAPLNYARYLPRVAFVFAAHELGDEQTLHLLATQRRDRAGSPWHKAHDDVARCIANALLGRHTDDASSTIEECRRLGLLIYADLASYAVRRDSEALKRLLGSGISWNTRAERREASATLRPTARELQVAELVAAGKTNQEIAIALVLSHRTVEAHLSNLFNKLGLGSRTQLAAWYLGR